MKKFIRYLYEYQKGRRVQNVGFVKVEEAGDSSVIQIYGRGFPVAKNQTMEIFLFYVSGKQCMGISMGQIKSMRSMFGYRLEYTADDVGGNDMFQQIDGIILQGSANGVKRWYGAVWDEEAVHIEEMIEQQMPLQKEQRLEESQQIMPSENQMERPKQPQMEEEGKNMLGEEQEERSKSYEMEEGGQITPGKEQKECPASQQMEEDGQMQPNQEQQLIQEQGSKGQEEKSASSIRKITRQDLAKLPRREWRLANNKFLLHGYHNYHHLISFRADGKCWLGVPGIYHPREQRAANAFGFGQFMRPEEGEIELEEDEKNAMEEFGYWCRNVSGIVEDHA